MKVFLIRRFKDHQIITCYLQQNEATLHLVLHPTHYYEELSGDLLVGSLEITNDPLDEDPFYDYYLKLTEINP
jgi:hypothetical protein